MKGSSLIVHAVVAFALVAGAVAAGADNTYLSVKGKKQGDIKGESTAKGHEGAMTVRQWSYEVQSPRDAASGVASGKRMHKPLTVTVDAGKSTPLLLQACYTNEVLDKVKLEVLMTNAKGEEATGLRVTLEDATVSQVRLTQAADSHDHSDAVHPQVEIEFTFHKITVESPSGNTSTSDNWSASGSGASARG